MNSQESKWKCSYYNNIFYRENQILLFSSATGKLFHFNKSQFQIIQKNLAMVKKEGRVCDSAIEDVLAKNGFIVPKNIDDCKELHRQYLANIHDEDITIFSVAPTMKCNFRCTYCFENQAEKSGPMDKITQDKLIDFFRTRAENSKRIFIDWFGGEPLCAFNVVERLSNAFMDISAKFGVEYSAHLSTNGFFLSEKILDRLPKLGFKKLHLPLDGTPHTFAERKGISVREANKFYDRIFQLIPKILKTFASLMIRINIDTDNFEEARYVVKRLKEIEFEERNIIIVLGRLFEDKNLNTCIPHNCIIPEEFHLLEVEFLKYLLSEGFLVFGNLKPIEIPCFAVKKHSYAVAPSGHFYRCLFELGHTESIVGSVHENWQNILHTNNMKIQGKFCDFDPWKTETCKNCRMIPLCLGYCPRVHEVENPFKCPYKISMEARMFFWKEYLDKVSSAGNFQGAI